MLPNPNPKSNEPASDCITVTTLTEEAVVSTVQESEAEAEPAPSNTIVDIPGVAKFKPTSVETTEEVRQRYDIEQKERQRERQRVTK